MQNNKCLVTGASGYIGSRLVRRLIDKGYEPAVILRPTSSLKHLQEIGANNITRFDYNGDVESLKEAVKFSNTVFHLATSNTFERRINTIDDMLNARVRFGTHILEVMHDFSDGRGGGICRNRYYSTIFFHAVFWLQILLLFSN